MYFVMYYIELAMTNNLKWSIAKMIQILYDCIIIALHCNALSNNLSFLTGTRGSLYIDINMKIVNQ